MNPQPTTVACEIRWIKKSDMPQVFDISDFSFVEPWHPETFKAWLSDRNTIAWVAEGIGGKIIGYMVYYLDPDMLRVLNIAVHPQHRLMGVGSAMIEKLKRKMRNPDRSRAMKERTCIVANVVEVDWTSVLFFRANGFNATKVVRDCFEVDGVSRDGYRMEWEK